MQARKQAGYIRDEAVVFAALRMLAALAIGAVRLSLDTFSREEGQRSLALLIEESFEALGQLAEQK